MSKHKITFFNIMKKKYKIIAIVFFIQITAIHQSLTFAESPSYTIKRISYVLENQFYDNLKGMMIKMDADFSNLKDHNVQFIGLLNCKNNDKWENVPFSYKCNEYYKSSEGNVVARPISNINVTHQNAQIEGTQLFIPYEGIVHPTGTVDYRLCIYLLDNTTHEFPHCSTTNSCYYYYTFSLVWRHTNEKGSPQNNSTTNYNQSNYNNTQSNRQNLQGGGYIEYTQQPDGRLTMKTVMPCTMCHGSNVCTSCWGQGGRWGAAYGGTWYPCPLCAGTGRNCCRVCSGKGEITTITFTDGQGKAYGFSSNGSTSQSNAAGTIVSTPYGTKVYPNGSSSSSSNSSSSSKSNQNDYIEQIVYDPDYTGNSPQVWCDKCNKYGPRHSHIKKRVY